MDLQPEDCIVPLFSLNESGGIRGFLGTAAFVRETNLLLTAQHVVRDWGGSFGIMVMPECSAVHRAELLTTDQKRDLALLKTPEFEADNALKLRELPKDIPTNEPIVCFEYGTTVPTSKGVKLNPATRLGNVTRFINLTELYNTAGDRMLELSFAALKGASGAPVMSGMPPFELLGMVIANISHHLLPAQIETVHDEEGEIEEQTSFMLPQALAVHFKIIGEFLEASEERISTPNSKSALQPS